MADYINFYGNYGTTRTDGIKLSDYYTNSFKFSYTGKPDVIGITELANGDIKFSDSYLDFFIEKENDISTDISNYISNNTFECDKIKSLEDLFKSEDEHLYLIDSKSVKKELIDLLNEFNDVKAKLQVYELKNKEKKA